MSCAADTLVVVVFGALASSTPKVKVNVRESASWRTSTPGGADTVIAPADDVTPGGGPAVVAPGVTVTDDGLISTLTGSVDGK